MTNAPTPNELERRRPARAAGSRRLVRYLAAALSAACALVYFMIGFGIIEVVDAVPGDEPFLLFFGVSAGLAFWLGALLLVVVDRRWVWIAGAAVQVLGIVTYVQKAETRTPPFEVWGVLLKIAEALILGALAYLVLRPSPAGAESPPRTTA